MFPPSPLTTSFMKSALIAWRKNVPLASGTRLQIDIPLFMVPELPPYILTLYIVKAFYTTFRPTISVNIRTVLKAYRLLTSTNRPSETAVFTFFLKRVSVYVRTVRLKTRLSSSVPSAKFTRRTPFTDNKTL